jgi:hypothetical protein
MQDLLNELEFAEIHHDPWESFRLFYKIAIVQSFLYSAIVVFGFFMDFEMTLWTAAFILPVITVVLMFRHHKKNIEESQRVKLLGILGLTAAYIVPFILVMTSRYIYRDGMRFSNNDMFFIVWISLVIAAVLFGVCAFSIFVLSSFRDRRRLK